MSRLNVRLFIAILIAIPTLSAQAATFTVTSTDDSGAGTLRQAIIDANANIGPDEIHFNIAGPTPHRIELMSELPDITDTVSIDGSTQLGYTDRPVIELKDIAPDGTFFVGLSLYATENTIRALAFPDCGNTIVEIESTSTSNTIQGCHIGLNAEGSQSEYSVGFVKGIMLYVSDGNLIGGAGALEGNVIGGPAGSIIGSPGHYGIELVGGRNNKIIGNIIGATRDGSQSAGIGTGMRVSGSYTVIGGPLPGEGNLITGYGTTGILFTDEGTSNTVQGNYIGTNLSGTNGLGVTGTGIDVYNSGHVIGGPNPGEGNLISGHSSNPAIVISSGDHIVIQGNRIGTTADGLSGLINRWGILLYGVSTSHARHILIGGSQPGEGNLISYSRFGNIQTEGANVNHITIQGNLLGTDITGQNPLGSIQDDGIQIANGGSDFLIGGTGPGEGNIIAFNGESGIDVLIETGNADDDVQPRRITILGNSIHSNRRIGIDLAPANVNDGPNLNDADDTDDGPNGMQNYPVLNRVVDLDNGGVIVEGALISLPNADYRVEFFANRQLNQDGLAEGERYLGFTMVTTDANGTGDFSVLLDNSIENSEPIISATATDSAGNTSEFSQAFQGTVPVELGEFFLE